MINRRKILAMIGLAPLATVTTTQAKITDDIHPDKGESYKDLYWQAQTHIDNLEAELAGR